MKYYEFIGVVVIFLVILIILVVGGSINKGATVSSTYNEEVLENIPKEGIEIDFLSDEVQKIYPFNGAFPQNELIYLTQIKNLEKNELTNENVLRLGFAKVTKDDWADSYTGEGEPLEINQIILEQYIKNIFGSINYSHMDFGNLDLKFDGYITSLYDNTYDKENKKYKIEIEAGDGIGESYIEIHTVKAYKFEDRIEIVINPIYFDNLGEQEIDDQFVFVHKGYAYYNYETEKFENPITGELATIYEYNETTKTTDYVEEIKNINVEQLEKYTITYKLNKANNNYEFSSIKYEK